MGLADKLADIIRPRPVGLFSGPAPASSTTTPGLSASSILSSAASEIAREGVRAFMRALETMRDPEVASRVDAFRDADEAATHATLEARGLSADGVPTYQLQGTLQSVVVHLNIPADDTSPAPAPTQSPVKVTWGGVPLRDFADDDEYFSIDPALARESLATICEWRVPELADEIKVFRDQFVEEFRRGIRDVKYGTTY